MKHKICLHAVNVKNKNQLPELIKKIWPAAVEQSKVKEKYFADEDFIKYRRIKFTTNAKKGFKLLCINGLMVVHDRMYPLNEIILEFNERDTEYALRLLKKLLGGKLRFVLDEPDPKMRIQQRQGSFKLWHLPDYDEEDLNTVRIAHLPVQIYEISKQWGMFLEKPGDKVLVRQLRVRLRRLRSAVTLFKPLFLPQQVEQWKQLLKMWADALGDAREYDVALLTCMKIKNSQKQEKISELEKVLLECRSQASARALQVKNINEVTYILASMLLFLYKTRINEEYSQLRVKSFLRRRLYEWCSRLQSLTIDEHILDDMEQLHRIRIKVKRLRYALQAAPEISINSGLLRSLKNMQDTLGFLHDNYVNDKLLADILQQHENNAGLRYETAMFCGWDSARRELILENLPQMWQDFCDILQEWQEEHL